MASAILPKSLQRTDSTGQLNVFLLLKKKINDELLIVSREDLPPTLRTGKLMLNQKIVIRDEERSSIEAVIVYMHSDRNNCLAFMKQLIQNKMQHMNQSGVNVNSSNSHSSSSCIAVSTKLPKNISKKTSTPLMSTRKATKPTSSNKQSIEAHSKLPYEVEDHREDDSNNNNISIDISNFSTSSTTNLNEKIKDKTTFDGTFDAFITTTDNNDIENDIYLNKINELSLTVARQGQIIKERDAELKRVRSTMMEMPSDQVTRDYICYMADKIRQRHKYIGNLTYDAKHLGIGVEKLNGILKLKVTITSIARQLFKEIIPEHKRSVSHWNELSEEVILKEKILIEFLVRYYGPLEVEPKKIHISLAGCLRNQRGKEKRLKEQAEALVNNNEQYDHSEEANDIVDDDNF